MVLLFVFFCLLDWIKKKFFHVNPFTQFQISTAVKAQQSDFLPVVRKNAKISIGIFQSKRRCLQISYLDSTQKITNLLPKSGRQKSRIFTVERLKF